MSQSSGSKKEIFAWIDRSAALAGPTHAGALDIQFVRPKEFGPDLLFTEKNRRSLEVHCRDRKVPASNARICDVIGLGNVGSNRAHIIGPIAFAVHFN